MAEHELKVWPEYFEALESGDKTFEVRKDDRGFAEGDLLILREWMPDPHLLGGHYTTARITRRVTYILRGGIFGIEPGYVVMGLGHPEEF